MRRREGGRRCLPLGVDGVGEGDAESDVDADAVGEGSDADGVIGRDFDLAFERSIHGFSGGIQGTVYCATAERERSHFLGTQTPTRTRQAATRRLALQGSD